MAKCWIYNELADIPDEFIMLEKPDNMFDDLRRILKRKNWIKENEESAIDSFNKTITNDRLKSKL